MKEGARKWKLLYLRGFRCYYRDPVSDSLLTTSKNLVHPRLAGISDIPYSHQPIMR